MRADSCSGPTTDSICGHGLGRMGHSSNFARWPHLGPIPPMDGGGHLVPLSYVYGYRGGVGRRGVGQDTIGDDGLEVRARVRRYQLILSRCAAGFVPKSGQRKNGRGATEQPTPGGTYSRHVGAAEQSTHAPTAARGAATPSSTGARSREARRLSPAPRPCGRGSAASPFASRFARGRRHSVHRATM